MEPKSISGTPQRRPLRTRTIAAWIFAVQLKNQETIPETTGKVVDNIAGIELRHTNTNDQIRIPWPLPLWPAGSDRIDTLNESWPILLSKLEPKNGSDSAKGLAQYAIGFLTMVLRIAKQPAEMSKTTDRTWKNIAKNLSALANNDKADANERKWAELHAPLLAAPESGIEPEEARKYLTALKKEWANRWKKKTPVWIAQRKERIGKSINPDGSISEDEVAVWLTKIRNAWTDKHPWYDLIESRDSKSGS